MVFALWLELFLGLCGNYVVMPMKIERAFSSPVANRKADGRIIHDATWRSNPKTFEFKAQTACSPFENVDKLKIMPSRGIFCRHGDEIRQQRGHFVFAPLQPAK